MTIRWSVSTGVADHARAVANGTEVLVLNHYLEVLRIKRAPSPVSPLLPGPGLHRHP